MSNTIRAQRAANNANVEIAGMTNQAQVDIAHEANEWNWANLQAQNEWNIQQWERENAYNDPSAQMERYIKAGINPVWALGNGDPGNAAHLESGSPQPAEVAQLKMAHVNPEYDPTKLNNIVAAARNLSNAGLGFSQLGINQYNAETARAGMQSQDFLNRASAGEKVAATNALEIENQWQRDTFSTRVAIESAKLDNIRKQLDVMDSQSDSYKAQKALYDAQEHLVSEKTARIAEDYLLAWKNLEIQQTNARANLIGANAQASQAKTASEALEHQKKFAQATVQHWNNDMLLSFLDKFGSDVTGKFGIHAEGKYGAKVGIPGTNSQFEVSGGVSGSLQSSSHIPADQTLLKEVGLKCIRLYAEDPSPENAELATKASNVMNDYINRAENDLHVPYRADFDSTGSSIINPLDGLDEFGSWSSWQ